MNTDLARLTSQRSRASVALVATAMAFWPIFTIFTVLEESAGLSWLRTSDTELWLPVAALALAAAISAPMFADFTPAKRCVSVALSIVAFAAAYGCCVAIGALFLGWND